MAAKRFARIVGTGSYLPQRVLSNSDLERMIDTSDEWILSRTGISERRIAGKSECPSHMGTAAAQKALASAGVTSSDLDLILVATMSPDYLSPATAVLIQDQLGATHAAALDFQAACTGFLYGLSLAKAYIESGIYQTVLLVASEKMSAFIDYSDRNTCVLFGDGAAAAVISSKGKGLFIDHICLGADGALAELVIIPGGGARHPATAETVAAKQHYFQMSGKEVFKQAVRHMVSAAKDCLAAVDLSQEEIGWLVPHQANARIIDAIAKSFEFPADRVYRTLHKYGNTSASSVAIALDELLQEHRVENGEHLLLVAFGGGLTWGAACLTQHLR